ncbi:hypothetical protein [Clostridium sp. UBA6640]|uniref:hypothetical protein n=1 Tax=Clostridium sp. UBA6640 TaxID=1946370 RepID=UPI0025C2E271|nr:hypothetical protein [Clostridium sp. UBA6640]
MIIKAKEFNQNNNDIYFIEILSDKIIINDNYNGILILDNNLELIKKLEVFDDITIYSSFSNNVNEEILLFCPDNECMVYIDLKTYEYNVIYLNNGLENLIFSNLYEWNENGLALSTYKGEFYSIYIDEKIIQKIDYKEVKTLYSRLYKFYQKSTKQKVIKVFPDEYIAIIEDEKCNINAFSYKKQIKHNLNDASINFIDIQFKEEIFVLVDENTIEIITPNDKEVLHPDENYIFLNAKFVSKLKCTYLVTLSSSNSNIDHSKIDMFEISTL